MHTHFWKLFSKKNKKAAHFHCNVKVCGWRDNAIESRIYDYWPFTEQSFRRIGDQNGEQTAYYCDSEVMSIVIWYLIAIKNAKALENNPKPWLLIIKIFNNSVVRVQRMTIYQGFQALQKMKPVQWSPSTNRFDFLLLTTSHCRKFCADFPKSFVVNLS